MGCSYYLTAFYEKQKKNNTVTYVNDRLQKNVTQQCNTTNMVKEIFKLTFSF